MQHSCLSTKPRVVAARFGSEDRFKYFGPEQPLERTSSGMFGGLHAPQTGQSPGPCYKPSLALTKSKSQEASFLTERRDPGGFERRLHAGTPGPGLYTPNDRGISTKRDFTPQGKFHMDDRHRYLGEVDPASLTPQMYASPGPMYNPTLQLTQDRPKTTAFGGRGPGTMVKPPSLKVDAPGPGSYTPMTQNACLSTKKRVPAAAFGVEQRNEHTQVDSSYCFHGRVPVEMQFNNVLHLSPGPLYKPSYKSVQTASQQPVIGTDRRFRA